MHTCARRRQLLNNLFFSDKSESLAFISSCSIKFTYVAVAYLYYVQAVQFALQLFSSTLTHNKIGILFQCLIPWDIIYSLCSSVNRFLQTFRIFLQIEIKYICKICHRHNLLRKTALYNRHLLKMHRNLYHYMDHYQIISCSVVVLVAFAVNF